MSENWFDEWEPTELYAKELKGVNQCSPRSPLDKPCENNIVCGPVLRLREMDFKSYLYIGSMLVITKDNSNAPNIEYQSGPSHETEQAIPINSNPIEAVTFYKTQPTRRTLNSYYFHRYDFSIPLTGYEQMIRYTVNGIRLPHYRFFVPAKDMNMNSISYSCNGFSLAVDTTPYNGSLWYDILRKHSQVHYHVLLGGGDQIYSDRIKIWSEKVKNWLDSDYTKRSRAKFDRDFEEEVDDFYLQEYIEWYGFGHWKGKNENSRTTQSCFPIAIATIPSVNIWDDHDIIDGFGSYSDKWMSTKVFSGIGNVAYKYYMLFQHQVSIEEKSAYMKDNQWVIGPKKGPFIEQPSHSVFTRLGPSMALMGLDCRTERKLTEILTKDTYAKVFDRLEREFSDKEKPKIDHLLLMLGVPIAYPRLVFFEWLFTSRLFSPVKYLVKKGIIAPGFVNEFNGDVELLDDLNDHWCAKHHKKERNFLMARLQDLSAKHGVRITILSGDVHLASVGRFRSKIHKNHIVESEKIKGSNMDVIRSPETDPRLMLNVISSAVVNVPPPNIMTKQLQRKSFVHHLDNETDEDSIPLFQYDVDRTERSANSFLNKRNWSDLIPIENIMANNYLKDQLRLKIGERVVPGILIEGRGIKSQPDNNENYLAYPVTERGLLASIHVETDLTSIKSETTAYCVPIPELSVSNVKLSHTGLKHWKT